METTREKKYESPEFIFREMKLTEKVAETCWGYGWAFVDHDANPETPPVNYYFIEGGGCEGNEENDLQNRLDRLLEKYENLIGKVGLDDVKTNVKDSPYIDYVGPSK